MSSAPLSAAQRMQQAHESKSITPAPVTRDLITEDPFPVAAADPSAPSSSANKQATKPQQVDVSDESAFPTLGGPSANGKGAPKSLWGGGGAAALRVKQNASPAPSRSSTPGPGAESPQFYSTTLQLSTTSIHISAPPPQRGPRGFSNERREDPKSLGDVIKEVMRRNDGVQIDASSSSKLTTFIIKGRGATAEAKVERAKVELLSYLEKKVTESVEVPANLRAVIIGAKGRTLKGITDSTGAQIQIPRDDEISADAPAAADSEDGPLISISISGPVSAVSAARDQIKAIVRERTSKTNTSLPDVPSELWAFLGPRVKDVLERLQVPEGEVNVFVPRRFLGKPGVDVVADAESGDAQKDDSQAKEKAVQVGGDKDVVKRVVEGLEAEVAELRSTVRPVTFSLPKRQHRFLVGTAIANQILEQTGCVVDIPPAENPSEDVIVRGPGRNTVQAMQLVFDLASVTPVETLDLFTAHRGPHDPRVYAAQLARYLLAKSRLRPIALSSGTQIYLPRTESIPTLPNAWLEIVGSSGGEGTGAAGVAQARQAVIAEVRKLPPSAFAAVEIDSLIHRHLIGKKGAKVRQFEADKSVEVVFPQADKASSDVLLVYSGDDLASAPAALADVRESLLALTAEFANLTSSTLTIPSSLHGAVIGQGGTTLNAVIGEEALCHVKFGGAAGEEDVVTIRGPSKEVERVKAELAKIAEDAKNDAIENSHIVEFEIATEHVRHIVGKAGSGVNKLRDDLGVRVDFSEAGKGKKSTVTVKGRKENAEEAKKRIEVLVKKIADEVTLTIPLPTSLDRGSLIGKQGTYLKRLEERHDVRILFPRDVRKGADGVASTPSPGEITIRGPSKGAQAAKGELIALIDYEKEHGNVLEFDVPVKALPRILGRGGSQVNQIKDDTGVASLDVDQATPESTTATITLRGTKASIKKAREAVEVIAKEVQDEVRLELDIPKELHTVLIGSGGSAIRELISCCGGPTDARASGNTVRFPRQGDAKDTVTITAPSAVANKIKEALEAEVAQLASRVVWGVVVPQAAHAAVIGKGAQALQDLQRKHGVKVVMPGWNDYAQAGAAENQEDVADAAEQDVVKVVGPKEAVLAAAEALRAVKPRGGPTNGSRNGSAAHSVEVAVPKKLHAQVAQGGRFFRTLPSGIRISHKNVKPPSSKPKKAPVDTSRIDDDGSSTPDELNLRIVPLADNSTGEDGEIPWVVESASQEDAEKVAEDIRQAVAKARSSSHVGGVTVPRGMMPRIVGRGGSGLDRLRSAGVEVEVVGKRDANQLTLTGSPDAIESAYQEIVELNAPRPPREARRIDDDY
ncbi:hypothetical protein JCM8547_004392 [Rhodosporidiobolus lusitaniae]